MRNVLLWVAQSISYNFSYVRQLNIFIETYRWSLYLYLWCSFRCLGLNRFSSLDIWFKYSIIRSWSLHRRKVYSSFNSCFLCQWRSEDSTITFSSLGRFRLRSFHLSRARSWFFFRGFLFRFLLRSSRCCSLCTSFTLVVLEFSNIILAIYNNSYNLT